MDCSLPGFSVHGILQTRILEWVVMPSWGSSRPRDRTRISCLAGGFFTTAPPEKPVLPQKNQINENSETSWGASTTHHPEMCHCGKPQQTQEKLFPSPLTPWKNWGRQPAPGREQLTENFYYIRKTSLTGLGNICLPNISSSHLPENGFPFLWSPRTLPPSPQLWNVQKPQVSDCYWLLIFSVGLLYICK